MAQRQIQLGARQVLILLLVGHALLGLAYNRLVPFGRGPDEPAHLLFIQSLAGEAPVGTQWRLGLPVMQTDWEDPNFEVHQPPLYYLAAVPLYLVGGPGAAAFLSLLASVATVWLTWRLARELVSEDLALAAAAVVALWPQQTYLATRLNNDLPANALWALCLWLWAHGLREGPSVRLGVWTGVALGCALLTKQTSLALVPLALLAAALQAWATRRPREALAALGATLGVAVLIAGWWFVRNQIVYGGLFAEAAFDERFLTRRITPEGLAQQFARHADWSYWPYVAQWTVRSAMVYLDEGAKNLLPQGVYPIQVALLAFATVGAVWALLRRAGQGGRDVLVAWAALAGAGLLLLGLLYMRFNLKYFQAQGRYFFGLLPLFGLWLAGGPSRLWPAGLLGGAPRRYGLLLAPLWFGLINALLIIVYLPGLYDE